MVNEIPTSRDAQNNSDIDILLQCLIRRSFNFEKKEKTINLSTELLNKIRKSASIHNSQTNVFIRAAIVLGVRFIQSDVELVKYYAKLNKIKSETVSVNIPIQLLDWASAIAKNANITISEALRAAFCFGEKHLGTEEIIKHLDPFIQISKNEARREEKLQRQSYLLEELDSIVKTTQAHGEKCKTQKKVHSL